MIASTSQKEHRDERTWGLASPHPPKRTHKENDMNKITFDKVYGSGRHLHAIGYCDHTSDEADWRDATPQELQEFDQCGQCVNEAEARGITVVPPAVNACPECNLVHAGDC